LQPLKLPFYLVFIYNYIAILTNKLKKGAMKNMEKNSRFSPRMFFLTVGFSGYSPKASGTAGSFVSLILGVLFLTQLPPESLFLVTILISLISIKIIDIYEKETKTHDSKHIVIDELAGMWFALSLAPAQIIDLNELTLTSGVFIQIILSFVYFRIFDIWKPSVIGYIDQKVKGGLSVMGDDIVAGLIAGILSSLTWKIITLI
jgi:phosphatidylglycerophosphatase A